MPKSEKQKLKILYIADYLRKYTDENHAVTANDIVDYLDECGIKAERKSVYRDIRLLRDEFEMDIEGGQGGRFRLMSREFDFEELQIVIECLHASKFLSMGRTNELVEVLKSDFMSEYQAELIGNDVFLSSSSSFPKGMLFNLSQIYTAMSTKFEGKKHIPQKISFRYKSTSFTRSENPLDLDRRKGGAYIVSPYKLIINNDHYYLLAFEDNKKEFRHYRVDRMKSIELIDEPREGTKEFKEINLNDYSERTFGMFRGEECKIQMRFINPLYDTVAERLGSDALFMYDDDRHFKVVATVELSNQFYAWVCGFRKGATITYPPKVVEDFNKFLKDIQTRYESE